MKKIILALSLLLFSSNLAFCQSEGIPAGLTRWLNASGYSNLKGLQINPNPKSLDRGLTITQTSPDNISSVGSIYSNLLQGSWNSPITGPGAPGTGNCACWSFFQIAASTGPNFDGVESYGLAVGNVVSGANNTFSDIVGISGGVLTNFATPNARIYGGTFAATTGANGSTPTLVGVEVAASQGNATISNVPNRIAVNAISYDIHQASTFDAAFAVSGGNPGGQFQHALALYTKQGTLAPALSTTGDFIYAESAQTVGSIINVPLLDISGYVYNTKHSFLTGSGTLVLGDTTVNGGISIKGIASTGNIATAYQLGTGVGGNPNWLVGMDGATSNSFFVYDVSSATRAINITNTAGILTTTMRGGDGNNPALSILSGSASLPGNINIGRTTAEALFGIAGVTGNFWSGANPGDFIIRGVSARTLLSTGYANAAAGLDASGHFTSVGGTAPSVGTCGTTPTVSGTDTKGIISVGSGVVTACTLTFGVAYASAPACVITSSSSTGLPAITAASGSAITITTSGTVGSGKLYYNCWS